MRAWLKPRRVIAAIVSVAAVAALWIHWRNAKAFADPRALLARFPVQDALVLSADVAALRSAGLITPSKGTSEPEYAKFVEATGFDYRRDLDGVVASISSGANYFIARGRFNWTKLRDYAAHQGGSCYEQLCRMPGSTAERRISFLPLRDDLIAIAVASDDLAANRLTTAREPVKSVPDAPVWLAISGEAMAGVPMPANLKMMLSGLGGADRISVTMTPANGAAVANFEARCRDAEMARVLASQLRNVTADLKEALKRDARSAADSVLAALAEGTFEDSGAKVHGQWPLHRDFVAGLTNGL